MDILEQANTLSNCVEELRSLRERLQAHDDAKRTTLARRAVDRVECASFIETTHPSRRKSDTLPLELEYRH